MLLKPAPVSTRQLSYSPATRTFIGEISSTNGFGQVWDDSTDEGLTLVSTTGTEVVYVVQDVDVDKREGEVRSWTLIPAAGQDARANGTSIKLFND